MERSGRSEPKNSSQTFTKIFPSPIPAFPLPGGNSDLTFAGCCRTPDSKAELGTPQNQGQPSCAPCFGRGTWPKGFASGSAPWPRWEQSTPGGEPTTQILYLQHRGDSRALGSGSVTLRGHVPREQRLGTVSAPSSAGPGGPGWAPKTRCSYCSRWPWHRPGRRR